MSKHIVLPAILTVAVAGIASAAGSLAPARIVARITSGLGPCSEVGGAHAVWVGNLREATAARIDPATNKVTGKVEVGRQPCGVAIGAASVPVDG
jgi:YVTN family beta-propeller protein